MVRYFEQTIIRPEELRGFALWRIDLLVMPRLPVLTNLRLLLKSAKPSFHAVAPDYPGFGQSSMPNHKDFAYTFENLTNVVEFLKQPKLAH